MSATSLAAASTITTALAIPTARGGFGRIGIGGKAREQWLRAPLPSVVRAGFLGWVLQSLGSEQADADCLA